MAWLVESMVILLRLVWIALPVPERQELLPASWRVLQPRRRQRFSRQVGCGRKRLLARSRHDRSAAGGSCRLPAGLLPSPRDAPPTSVPPVLLPRLPGLQEQEGYPGKTDSCSLPSLGSGSPRRELVPPPGH